jgi:hypothetical protein
MVPKPFIFRNPLALKGLLQFLLFLSTATASAIPRADRTNQKIRWVDCHDKVPDAIAPDSIPPTYNVTGGTITGPLPANLFCGEMDVPMDYTKPFDAVTNNITIGFAMNRPQKRAQGLILQFFFVSCFRKRLLMIIPSHAGGPGENAAAQAWANAFNLSYAFVGLEDFDFLGGASEIFSTCN